MEDIKEAYNIHKIKEKEKEIIEISDDLDNGVKELEKFLHEKR
jgi:hypothetical protein